jgi:hypothetical protein
VPQPVYSWYAGAMTSTFMLIAAAAIAVPICAGNVSAEPRRGGKLLPPVSPACISSPFGPRVLPSQPQAGSYHYGIDLPAPVGTPVIATAPGTVIRLQNKGPGGLEMLVQHNGFVAIYSHFSMFTPAFAEGRRIVAAGEKLGEVGTTGVTSGAHLYFEMDLAGKPIDPAPYIGAPDCNGEVRRTLSRTLDVDGQTQQYFQYQSGLEYYQPSRQYSVYRNWNEYGSKRRELGACGQNGRLFAPSLIQERSAAIAAEFERGLLLERQREGVAKAKLSGKYEGWKPMIGNGMGASVGVQRWPC